MAETKIRAKKATTLLKEDHEKVKKLFKEYERLEDEDPERKAAIFETLNKELTIHAQIEEEIFYPAVQTSEDEEAGELVKEAHEEHRVMKLLLGELEALTPGEEDFDAKLKVLMENTLHHIEEEQKDIFKLFDKLDKGDRDEIAERLVERKRELNGEA